MIRRAVPADKMRALSMAKAFHAASGLPFPFSAAHAERLFLSSLSDPDRVCLVIDDNGLKGVLAAQAYDYQLGSFRAAVETFWWVSPTHWRQMPGLVSEYEAWAISIGCDLVGMGMIGGKRASRAFERIGYRPVEQMFVKDIRSTAVKSKE